MDWNNEIYVKLYRRDTPDDLLLSWEARALWHEMLKKFDRSGIIEARRGAPGLAALVRIPLEVVESALLELLEDGRIQVTERGWVAPNFMAAQEASKSNRLRQEEKRDKRRQQAVSQLRHDSTRDDTPSNGSTHGDPRRHSDLILADLNRSELRRACARDLVFPERFERRRIPEEPGVFMVIDENGSCLGLVRIDEDGNEVKA